MHSSLTSQLTQLIKNKPIVQDDLDAAALYLLDAMANAVAGRSSEAGEILLNWVSTRQSDEGRLAFALGGLTHIVEMDDLHRTSVTHPGCVVIPAVIATATKIEVSGQQILTAILHGFEACARVGMAVGTEHYVIWHNTATCGPFGSAMAVSTLLGLDDSQTINALGNAGTQSSGFWQFLETGAMSKHLHAGRAAESGMLAVQLAAQGFTGPAQILEGKKGMFAGMCNNPVPGALTANPQAKWQLHETSIKPWPSCRHTHPVIDAALELADKVAIAEVEYIKINTYQAAVNVCNRERPNSLYEAKFSLQHCVVAALTTGKIDFQSFDERARQMHSDSTSQVSVCVTDEFESAYPDAWGASVTVHLKNGDVLGTERNLCKGDPDMPLNRQALIEKARMLMAYGGLDEQTSQTLITNLLGLGKGEEFLQAQILKILI